MLSEGALAAADGNAPETSAVSERETRTCASDTGIAPKMQLEEFLSSTGWTASEVSDCNSDALLDVDDALAAIDAARKLDFDTQPSTHHGFFIGSPAFCISRNVEDWWPEIQCFTKGACIPATAPMTGTCVHKSAQHREVLRSRGWTAAAASNCDSDALLDVVDALAAIDAANLELE